MLSLEKMSIARPGHPAGPCEMAFVNHFRAFRFLRGVDAKNDRNRLAPVCTLSFRIQQAQIGHKMPLVIRRHAFFLGRLGLERWRGHSPISTSTRCDLAKLSTIPPVRAFPYGDLRGTLHYRGDKARIIIRRTIIRERFLSCGWISVNCSGPMFAVTAFPPT